jgi:hypothetical protein
MTNAYLYNLGVHYYPHARITKVSAHYYHAAKIHHGIFAVSCPCRGIDGVGPHQESCAHGVYEKTGGKKCHKKELNKRK